MATTGSGSPEALDIRPALSLLADAGIELHPTELVLPDDLSYESFERLAGLLGRLHGASKWWVADFVCWGEGRYGDRIYQAALALGLAEQTIRNYASVAGRVAPARRRSDLSFSTHSEVAALDPEQQEKYLALAEENGYGSRQVRELLNDAGLRPARPQPSWTLGPGGTEHAAAPPDPSAQATAAPPPRPDPPESEAPPTPGARPRHPFATVLARLRDRSEEEERDALTWALAQLAPELA